MNTNALAKQYTMLSAEERFRLILAADTRGDEAEGNRLANSNKRISLSMPDHAPYVHAFHELVFMTYIDMVDDAACCLELYERGSRQLKASIEIPKARKRRTASTPPTKDEPRSEDAVDLPDWHYSFRAAYGVGYFLKAKLVGWTLFCNRWNASPTTLWEQMDLPGLDRLKRAFALAHNGAAYGKHDGNARKVTEQSLRWTCAGTFVVRIAKAQPRRKQAPIDLTGVQLSTQL